MTDGHDDDDRLDRLARRLLEASAMSAGEMEAIASPFLSSRLSARIAAERERRARSAPWLDLLIAGRRTVPAMLAIGAALAGWLSIRNEWFNPSSTDSAEPHLERVVLTGTAVLSDDDVLRFLMGKDPR